MTLLEEYKNLKFADYNHDLKRGFAQACQFVHKVVVHNLCTADLEGLDADCRAVMELARKEGLL